MRSFLRQVGRREIDRDTLWRKREADGIERGAHPLTTFSHCLVRQTDDNEGWNTAGNLHLHLYRSCLQSKKSDCRNQCHHQSRPPLFPPALKIDLSQEFAYRRVQSAAARNGGLFTFRSQEMTYEAHLSAKPPRAQASPRLPFAFRNARWPQGSGRSSRARPQDAFRLISGKIETIGRRADFLAANAGKRVPMPSFVLLVRRRGDDNTAMRLGITVTKKIGNAVVRNRMKRRFRSLAREVLPLSGVSGADHILIGRSSGVERDFDDLRRELAKALEKAVR